MPEKFINKDVPFFPNIDNRCAVATNQMILGFFEPTAAFSQKEIDDFTGYIEGQGAWGIASALHFAERGYDIVWIEDFDFRRFSEDAVAYLREIFQDDKKVEYQLKHSDIPAEQARAKEYIARNLPFEKREGTLEDVRRLIGEGYLVRLEVNGMPLAGQEGYDGHVVLAIGYETNEFIIHNPDGVFGPKPNQGVTSELLYRAWKEFGGSFALQAFRRTRDT